MLKKGNWMTKLILIVLVVVVLAGCSSSRDSDNSYDSGTMSTGSSDSKANYDYDMAPMEESVEYEMSMDDMAESPDVSVDVLGNQAEGQGADLSDRKIIETRDIYMETLEFDVVTRNVENLVYNNLGYIESSNVTGLGFNDEKNREYNPRYAYFTLRVPAEYYEGFVETLLTYGYVISNNVDKQDVTNQYMDLETRINTLLVQEERLLALLDQSARLEDIMELERELADVRYEIESYTSYLMELDNKVRYSTVYLEVREVFEIEEVEAVPVTFGERISSGFKDAWEGLVEGIQDFIVWFARNIFGLIIWLVILYVAFRGLRWLIRKMKVAEASAKKQKHMTGAALPDKESDDKTE